MKFLTVFLALLAMTCTGLAQYQKSGADADQQKLYVKLQKEQTASKGAFQKAPKNLTVKKKYVDATVKLGTFCMNTPILDRKVKYAKALHFYREALKVDPSNPEAKQNSDMIISIYKSMGRPVPKDGG